MGDAIVALLRDPARSRSLGEAGRRRATSEFSHAAMVRRIEDVYRDILGQPAPQIITPDEEPELRTTR
jgi:glycosyltransferase involved in cell wall biosynthesis